VTPCDAIGSPHCAEKRESKKLKVTKEKKGESKTNREGHRIL
jgi:hypothetical protein